MIPKDFDDFTESDKIKNLLEKAERLQLLLDTVPDIICFKDGEGRWLEANKADLKMFQLEDVDYYGKKDSELAEYSLFHRDAFLACEDSDEIAWNAGHISRGEEKILQPDGTTKIFDIIKIPVFNPDGTRKGLFVFGRDITTQKNLEEELQINLNLHKKAQSMAKIGHWFWNIETGGLKWSDEVYNIFGYKKDKIQPSYPFFLRSIHPDDSEMVINAVNNAVEKGIKYSVERRITQPDGNIRYVHEEGDLEYDINGKPVSMMGTVQDITLFSLAQKQLNLVIELFNNSIEGVIITDENSKIIMANPAVTRITGYEPHEIIGNNPSLLKSDRHEPAFYKKMWEELKNKGKWTGEIWNRRKNGEIYPEILNIITLKDVNGRVTNYASVFHDLTELKTQEEKLRVRENYDPLTGLPNSALFFDRLDVEIKKAGSDNTTLSVLNLDVDDFKRINNSLSHTKGDYLLTKIATRLVGLLDNHHTIARIGGDNFSFIISGYKDIFYVIDLVQHILSELSRPFVIDNLELVVTGSIGVGCFPNDGRDASTLFKNAEISMYEAKKSGGNRYNFYTQGLDELARDSLFLEANLRKAINEGSFILHYQPRINLNIKKIAGAEALIRWVQPDGSIIPPLKFIPFAEKSGLIIPIGEWVLRESCRQIKKWSEAGHDVKLSLNLSPRQFRDENLYKTILEIIKETSVNPKLLEIEITESAIIENEEKAINLINSLKEMGIRLSIDDFGTGYSSFYYLNKLPIDSIKIDRSFIKDYPSDNKSIGIVSAMIAMAKSLGLKVVAEGVEIKEQLEFLQELQCDEIQGYYFSPPVPAHKMEYFLKKGI